MVSALPTCAGRVVSALPTCAGRVVMHMSAALYGRLCTELKRNVRTYRGMKVVPHRNPAKAYADAKEIGMLVPVGPKKQTTE
jgi:hypothetical protein